MTIEEIKIPVPSGEIANFKGEKCKASHVLVTLRYDKEKYNIWSGQPKKRGYYLAVQPVTIGSSGSGFQTIQFQAFTGYSTCLLEVQRSSKKAEEDAMRRFRAEYAGFVKRAFPELEVA